MLNPQKGPTAIKHTLSFSNELLLNKKPAL